MQGTDIFPDNPPLGQTPILHKTKLENYKLVFTLFIETRKIDCSNLLKKYKFAFTLLVIFFTRLLTSKQPFQMCHKTKLLKRAWDSNFVHPDALDR